MTVFDKYAENYDEGHTRAVAMSGFKPSYFHEYKLKEVLQYIKQNGLTNKKLKLLDFGCGTGSSIKYIKKYLPNASIYGVDVSKEEIRVAKKSCKNLKNVTIAFFDGNSIPFNVTFDIIFIANVFHHIKRDEHKKVLKKIYAKMSETGRLFFFELNPLNPLTMLVAIKNDYRFDKNANLLNPLYSRKLLRNAGFLSNKVNFRIFFPQCLSALIKYEKYLSKVPLGAHYYYIAKKDSRRV